MHVDVGGHADADSDLAEIVTSQSDENLRVYATSATRVDEDAGQEMNLAHGGYGKRQLLELIQNGADAMISAPGGRIEVVLTEGYLYCANQGDPIDADGVKTLLHAHISNKRGAEIGRFGLGFKSVLGVTDAPEFFSSRVSFGFDAEWAKDQIWSVVPNRRRYPVLRMARLLDLQEVRSSDSILAELMSFATSVVRLPRNIGPSQWLHEDIKAFDPSFMLFSPHVGKLILRDTTAGLNREIKLKQEGEEVAVTEGMETRRWRVFKSSIRPSDQAKREAWELQSRDTLPLIWAVPTEGRLSVGRFWAFFNLRDETTLTGIANAPWQINDDRTGLLEGSQLNKELLDRLAALVLESVPDLIKIDDPGWILDVIPARGSEARCWGDAYLTNRFYELAVRHAVVPDQDGRLRFAETLKLPPTEASRQALDVWAASPGRPSDWCHASAVATRTRRSRVERLFEAAGLGEQSSLLWLEALVDLDEVGVDHVAGAIRTAAAFIRPDDPDAEGRRRAAQRCKILLDNTARLREADPSNIFMPRDGESESGMVRLIDSDLVSRAGVREALAVIGIKEVSPALELKAFISRGTLSNSAEVWNRFWILVRQFTDADEITNILTTEFAHRALRVRTVSGSYHPLFQTLLPGCVVPPDGSRDAEVAIDTVYHQDELEVIRRMGADQAPTVGFPVSKDGLVTTYLNHCIPAYLNGLPPHSSNPQLDRLVFDRQTHVGPLEPLRHLSSEGRAAFTDELIRATTDWRPWVLKHDSQRIYPPREFDCPAIWAIESEGRLRTDLGIVPVARAWGRLLQRWADLAHVARSVPDHVADLLGIPSTAAQLTSGHWQDAFTSVLTSTNDKLIGDFYTFAAETGTEKPAQIRCRIGTTHGERPPLAVVVTHDREAFEALKDLELPSLQVSGPEASRLLIEKWQLVPSSALVRQETHWVQEGAAATLADAFPTLRTDLEAEGLTHAEIVPCRDIVETITTDRGAQTVHKEFARLGDRFVWKTDLGLEEALRRIAKHLPFQLSDEEIADLAEGRWKQDRRDRLREIHDEPHNEGRLLRALGEERLRARLPVGLLDAVNAIRGDGIKPVDVARLMLAVHGDDTVHYLRDGLRDAGLDPPDRWAGGREARMFVRDLGFPDEFAGAPADRRDPELIVPGPPNLPPLHDYQDRIVREIHRLLFEGDQHPRGLISLPTGAGKTRVATQALVQAICGEGLECPVLWIAPSDELCEQAVQTWSEVWRAVGSMDELRVGRLWGPNEVPQAIQGHQIVVATVDKLRNRVASADYEWLAKATCVVVDEAHAAITPEYTTVLKWLGFSATGSTMVTRVPLVGLTATPFRGTSEEETKRLVSRFGGRRLDRVFGDRHDEGATYRVLQQMDVLSRVDGEVLETGMTIDVDQDLSREERNSFERLGLPSRIFDKLARDIDRNRTLLESICSRPDDWPILLFAVSVEHAHTMAALLSLEGVSAAAIDYSTEPAIRRRYVDRFRAGDLRVIANFNVLAQGFDAPATRAIYVARPTFSPNNYQQMIGRGLRGPLNGGKDRCLIVNVLDNWITYGDSLAFYEFEHLWTAGGIS